MEITVISNNSQAKNQADRQPPELQVVPKQEIEEGEETEDLLSPGALVNDEWDRK